VRSAIILASFCLQGQRAGLAQVMGRYMEPIVFELRDIDADVVRAWERYFKGVANVRISHGDIFENRLMQL
jgi:hypothetical protein